MEEIMSRDQLLKNAITALNDLKNDPDKRIWYDTRDPDGEEPPTDEVPEANDEQNKKDIGEIPPDWVEG